MLQSLLATGAGVGAMWSADRYIHVSCVARSGVQLALLVTSILLYIVDLLPPSHTHKHTHTHTRTHMHMHTHAHTCTHTHAHAHT